MRLGAGSLVHKPSHKRRTITLRGLEIYVEGGLADEGENGSQPNN